MKCVCAFTSLLEYLHPVEDHCKWSSKHDEPDCQKDYETWNCYFQSLQWVKMVHWVKWVQKFAKINLCFLSNELTVKEVSIQNYEHYQCWVYMKLVRTRKKGLATSARLVRLVRAWVSVTPLDCFSLWKVMIIMLILMDKFIQINAWIMMVI